MVKVTAGLQQEHCYYLDGYLVPQLEDIKKNVRKDYDGFILCVGREGFGKTTLSLQSAMYVDPTFNLDRVVFTAEQFLEAVEKAEKYQAIVFDETMGYLSSRNAMSSFNKALIKVMSEMRSKNLIVFLNIPNLFMMDWYVATHRSTGLLYVYKRSFFASYDYKKKARLYKEGKRHHSYHVPPTYRGKFVKYFPLDKEAYEKKKQKAVNSWISGNKKEVTWKIQRDLCIKYIRENTDLTMEAIGNIMGLTKVQISTLLRQFEEKEKEDTE